MDNDNHMHYGSDYKYIPATSIRSGQGVEVLPDLYHYTIQIVNIQLVGTKYLYNVITQEQEISGPPAYFTPDWESAKLSVKKLATLRPAIAVTGHGLPMSGQLLTESLERLAKDFDTLAKPEYGKYIH